MPGPGPGPADFGEQPIGFGEQPAGFGEQPPGPAAGPPGPGSEPRPGSEATPLGLGPASPAPARQAPVPALPAPVPAEPPWAWYSPRRAGAWRPRTGFRVVHRPVGVNPVAVPARCASRTGLSPGNPAGGDVRAAGQRVVAACGLAAGGRTRCGPPVIPDAALTGIRQTMNQMIAPYLEPAGEAALLRQEPRHGAARGRAPGGVPGGEVPVSVPAPHGCDRLRDRGVPLGAQRFRLRRVRDRSPRNTVLRAGQVLGGQRGGDHGGRGTLPELRTGCVTRTWWSIPRR